MVVAVTGHRSIGQRNTCWQFLVLAVVRVAIREPGFKNLRNGRAAGQVIQADCEVRFSKWRERVESADVVIDP